MGSTLPHDERYAYTDEWIPIFRAAIAGETVNVEGRHLTVRDGKLALRPVQQPTPPLWFEAPLPPALRTAAKHIDTPTSSTATTPRRPASGWRRSPRSPPSTTARSDSACAST